MKYFWRLMVSTAALSVILMMVGVTAVSAQMDSYKDVLARSSLAVSADGKVIMVLQKNVQYLIAGDMPEQLRMPVVVANISGQNDLTVKEFIVKFDELNYSETKPASISLPGMSDSANFSTGRYNFTMLKDMATMSVQSFKLPGNIEKGKVYTLAITAVITDTGGYTSRAEGKLKITFASLPVRYGWYCGDGHMHTTWSDGLDTLEERALYLKNAGMGWAVITDHEKLLRGRFEEYQRSIGNLSSILGMPLAAGIEVIVSGDRGHALAYGLNERLEPALLPQDTQYLSQDLIDNINNLIPENSFAVVAHPYSSTIWQDISTSRNFKTMEIATGSKINPQSFEEWMRRLRAGEKITALGSSDCHLGYPEGMTFLFMPDYSISDFNPVWRAIKLGRAAVSEKGHLAVFAVNNQAIGSTLKVDKGEQVTFKLIQQACSGVTCERMQVLDENAQAVYEIKYPSEQTFFKMVPDSSFYIVRAYFSDGSQTVSNPVYLDFGIN